MPPKLTPEIITAAIDGFEAQKVRLDSQISELRALLSGSPTESAAATPEPKTRKRRRMSAAGRKAIAEAQRKRWAASRKAATEPSAPEAAPKKKRKMSRAGRAAIIAATKKRWEAVRAAKAEQEKAATKKPAKKTAAKKRTTKASTPAVGQAGAQ